LTEVEMCAHQVAITLKLRVSPKISKHTEQG